MLYSDREVIRYIANEYWKFTLKKQESMKYCETTPEATGSKGLNNSSTSGRDCQLYLTKAQ